MSEQPALGPFNCADDTVEVEAKWGVRTRRWKAIEILDQDANTAAFVVIKPQRYGDPHDHRHDAGEVAGLFATAPETDAERDRLKKQVAAYECLDEEGAASLAVDLSHQDAEVKRLRDAKEKLEAVVKSLAHAGNAALPILEVFADDPAPDEVPDWVPMMRPVIDLIESAIAYAKHVVGEPLEGDVPALVDGSAAKQMVAALEAQFRWHAEQAQARGHDHFRGTDLYDQTLSAIEAGKKALS